ncbi:MAG TPA: hypothetical protein VKV15_19315 [Bryobacteraceae bacterium]|nr:hypothetical protein [Bryobacteraceae bacterium]
MKCLHCGNELALLKKLTGGGGFCSESHRQSYQEEYDRLALRRLLQPHAGTEDSPSNPAQNAPLPTAVAEAAGEVSAPPAPGFVKFDLTPALSTGQYHYSDEPLAREPGVAMPSRTPENPGVSLAAAAPVAITVEGRSGESAPRRKERLEGRDFTRTTPAVTPHLETLQGRGLSAMKESMEVFVLPVRPEGTTQLWHFDGIELVVEPCFREMARLGTSFLGRETPVEMAEPGASSAESKAPVPVPMLAPAESAKTDWGQKPAAEEKVQAADPADPQPAARFSELWERGFSTPEKAKDSEEPVRATSILPISIKGSAPGKGKLTQSFQSIAVTSFRLNLPRVTGLPLRPKMTIGAAPAEAKFKLKTADQELPAGPPAARAAKPERPAAEPDTQSAAQPPAAEKKPEPPAALKKEGPAVQPAPSDADRLRQVATAALDGPHFGMAASDIGSPFGGLWRRLPVVAKIAVILATIGALGVAGWIFQGSSGKAGVAPGDGSSMGPSIMMGEGGWSTNWAGDAAGSHRARQISIYRPSLNMRNYRLEFQGEIESKSMGWVFRASNAENYYAMKLEIVKPGLSPTVALVKWAVVNGQDSPEQRAMLPMPLRLDTLYRVRLDVRGARFVTSVQDQPVDSWADDQLKTGGVGFFNERGERGRIRKVQISLLSGN